ncbi:MAG: hypothetical protein FJ288_05145 [Planctomycetes bacterium]|nr:hypothetical protein [Planctomycetota bacterium]
MADLLSEEIKTYEANFEALLGAHEGKFVVIRGAEVQGTFDNQMDAVAWGYRRLGNVPFLVRQVVKVDVPLSFVSNLLGV